MLRKCGSGNSKVSSSLPVVRLAELTSLLEAEQTAAQATEAEALARAKTVRRNPPQLPCVVVRLVHTIAWCCASGAFWSVRQPWRAVC
jgi:hypothetical protein